MATVGESSSAPPKPTDDKPVVVRVKRKAFHSRLDCFWLEINERPLKRSILDFEKLSISDSSKKEELKTKKVLVRHVETVRTTKITTDIVQSFVERNSADAFESKTKSEERRHTFKKENRHDQILTKSIQEQEIVAKNARFEQIWRKRKGDKVKLQEMCHFYDVVRVDVEERSKKVQEQEEALEEQRILANYLPLLRDFIPSAAEELESQSYKFKQESSDDFVYDYYTVESEMDMVDLDADASHPFPLVQVDDEDDFCDGPDESEYDSDDSNAEYNPLNDYPDEMPGEEGEEDEDEESEASENELEENGSEKSSESDGTEDHGLSDDVQLSYEDDIYDYDDYEDYEGDGYGYHDDDSGGDDEYWG